MIKRPFDIEIALERIEQAVKPYPMAMLFALASDGFDSPFEQLVACMISIRTRDEVSLVLARRLFERAHTPEAMLGLSVDEIDELIHQCSFHQVKASQILTIAREAIKHHDGAIPCDQEALMSHRGVGLKCANLVLGIACGMPRVAVDVHVHRIANRWGYVRTKTANATSIALEEIAPREKWIDLNRLLVPFGKHICTGRLPRCSSCPVADMCARAGVDEHR